MLSFAKKQKFSLSLKLLIIYFLKYNNLKFSLEVITLFPDTVKDLKM